MVERLDQVVVRAGIEAGDAFVDRAARRDDQDRHGEAGDADRTDQLEPVAIRQAEIHQNEVIGRDVHGGARVGDRRDGVDAPFRLMDGLDQQVAKPGTILDKQKSHALLRPVTMASTRFSR